MFQCVFQRAATRKQSYRLAISVRANRPSCPNSPRPGIANRRAAVSLLDCFESWNDDRRSRGAEERYETKNRRLGRLDSAGKRCSMLWTVFAFQLIGVPATSGKAGDIEVEINVPKEAKVGSSIELGCEWRLHGGDGLYSVKWYKDDHEFFRYVPDDNPRIQTFPQPGITIDKKSNSEKSIGLTDVGVASSGLYKCEVSTEAPSFATTYRTGKLTVIALPERGPEISGLTSPYAVGDNVTANCTVWPSVPKATVRWLVNGKPIATERTIEYSGAEGIASPAAAAAGPITVGLRVELKPWHLEGFDGTAPTVAIKCVAEIGESALETEKIVSMVYVNNERLSGGDTRGRAGLHADSFYLSLLGLPLLLYFAT